MDEHEVKSEVVKCRAAEELTSIKGTLLVNYGPEAKHDFGIRIQPRKRVFGMLIDVLEQLHAKIPGEKGKAMKRVCVGLPGTRLALMFDVDPGFGEMEVLDKAQEMAQAEFKDNGGANAIRLSEGAEPDIYLKAHPGDVARCLKKEEEIVEVTTSGRYDIEEFQKRLEDLINECNMDGFTETADHILARHMVAEMMAFARTMKKRDDWRL